LVLSSFIITSRETLEAALVVGVVMAYLSKTQNNQYKKTVYYGIGFGILLSLLSAFLFTIFAGGFSGTSEKIFEGSIMLFAAFLLTTMIFWMMKQRNIAKNIENKVSAHITSSGFNAVYSYGLFVLITIAILREGVETVTQRYLLRKTMFDKLSGNLELRRAELLLDLFDKGQYTDYFAASQAYDHLIQDIEVIQNQMKETESLRQVYEASEDERIPTGYDQVIARYFQRLSEG